MTQPLSYGEMLRMLSDRFRQLPDTRTGENSQYTMLDAAMGAFGVFFTQSPSFLAYQRDMQRLQGRNNARSLFGVETIPSDAQIRNLLDGVEAQDVGSVLWDILARLDESGALTDYAVPVKGGGTAGWLCALDGTQYFHSTEIHCENCTESVRAGTTHYAHTVLIPVLVSPSQPDVIVLEPEFIQPQDGAEKQDCERNAARRWIERHATRLVDHQTTILADDLHCNQPFCELLLSRGLNFIMTCKPDSHSTLYEEVARLAHVPDGVMQVQDRFWTGRDHEVWSYRFASYLPLRAGGKALQVNWCELTITRETTGKILYHNAFATNLPLSQSTLRPTAAAGRARWKIENEGNNVLKNHGYHLEHNYGHGQHHLSAVLVMLNLLAFLFHTVLQRLDDTYQRLRRELATRRTFFNDISALTRYLFFDSWEALLAFMLAQLKPAPD